MARPLLLQRLIDVHRALDRAGFDHAVGGALALAVHVPSPRFTDDIDLNVIADAAHPDRLLASFPVGVEIHVGAAGDLRRDGQTRLFWRAEPRTPVDVFLPQDPEYHRLVNDRASLADFDGVPIKVLTATDLMVFKMMFDRPKDWVDIQSLIEAGAGEVDEAGSWIETFLGPDDLRLSRLRDVRAASSGGPPPFVWHDTRDSPQRPNG